MSVITGAFYAQDSDIRESSLLDAEDLVSGIILYEVMRMTDGVILFLEDHLARLNESIRLSGYKFTITSNEISATIRDLSLKNNIFTGNVKIIIHCKGSLPVRFIYFVPHHYPDPVMYATGVRANLFRAARLHPNIKKLHPDLISSIMEFIKQEQLYDALLVDQNESVTEGSRTNVFFVKGSDIFTPPGNMVLKGITRQKVIALCNQLNINLIEQPVYIKDLTHFDGAFFTGTSPKVLPIRQISDIDYNVSNAVMRRLMVAYDEMMVEYQDRNRN